MAGIAIAYEIISVRDVSVASQVFAIYIVLTPKYIRKILRDEYC